MLELTGEHGALFVEADEVAAIVQCVIRDEYLTKIHLRGGGGVFFVNEEPIALHQIISDVKEKGHA